MTKIDLADMTETNKWIKYYEDKGYKVVTANLTNTRGINKIIEATNDVRSSLNEEETKGTWKLDH